jgi:hypothetical protein
MKKKLFYSSLLLSVMLMTFASCTSEDTATEEEVKGEAVNLTLNVTQGSFNSDDANATRTAEDGNGTTFTNDDAIGVFVVSGSTVTVTNAKYTFDGTNWKNESATTNISANVGDKFFAYYPYNANFSSTNTVSATTATDFFATYITNFGDNLSKDQSTQALYTANDLMVSGNTVTSGMTSCALNMAHQMAAVEFDFPQILYLGDGKAVYRYNFADGYKPYNTSDGVYRMIMKPDATLSPLGGNIYKDADKTPSSTPKWSTEATAPEAGQLAVHKGSAGTAASLKRKYAGLAVGQLYYSDGTYSSTLNTSKTPIGVIVSTTNDCCEPTNYGHGLVMALTNAGVGINWSTVNTNESDLNDVTNVTTWMADKSGLSNTTKISKLSTFSQKNYPAFYNTVHYQGSAPSFSSGWFLASSYQWYETLLNAQTFYNGKHSSATIDIPYTSWATSTTNKTGSIGTSNAGNCAKELSYIFSQFSGLAFDDITYTVGNSNIYWTSSEYLNSSNNTTGGCDVNLYAIQTMKTSDITQVSSTANSLILHRDGKTAGNTKLTPNATNKTYLKGQYNGIARPFLAF